MQTLSQSRRAREKSQYHQPKQHQSTGVAQLQQGLKAEMKAVGQPQGKVRNTTESQRSWGQHERAETKRGAGCEFPEGNTRDMLAFCPLQGGGWLRSCG